MIAFILTCMGLAVKVCVGLIFWLMATFIFVMVLSCIAKYYLYCRDIHKGGDDGNNYR